MRPLQFPTHLVCTGETLTSTLSTLTAEDPDMRRRKVDLAIATTCIPTLGIGNFSESQISINKFSRFLENKLIHAIFLGSLLAPLDVQKTNKS